MRNKSLIIILIVISILINVVDSVFAVTKKVIDNSLTGSITLTVYEFINGDENNKKELKGAEFTIYSIPSSILDVTSAENYIANNEVTKNTEITNQNGVLKFDNLQVGRYFIKETNAPKNVYTKVESFLVDIPSTNENGTEWNYDIVAYPKNVTVYADVELTKKNINNEAMAGVKFKLQKYVDSSWQDYELENELVTDSNGKIAVHNLEVGKFRLVEIESIESYIVDSSNTQEFEVSLNNTNIKINMSNEKVEINKYVLLSDGSYGKHLGANYKDVVSWKIESTVPSIISKMETYTIQDKLSDGLKILDHSIKVYGVKDGNRTLLQESDDYITEIKSQLMTIILNPQSLDGYSNIEVEYQTKFNTEILYGKAATNEATITYTNNINLDGKEKNTYTTTPSEQSTAEVHTGELLIYKTDGENPLEGARFKIATSEDNAKNGIYVTDADGEDITANSGRDGYAIFQGLKYGSDGESAETGSSDYWIVEVQAPSYEENEETKYYNLLSKPVKVQVNSNSGVYSSSSTEVINKKGFALPRTGTIGTISLITVGLAIIISSMYIRKKKTKNEKKN